MITSVPRRGALARPPGGQAAMSLLAFAAAMVVFSASLAPMNVAAQPDTSDPICVTATDCNLASNCRCASTETPGDIERDKTPQLILLSFDDAITIQLYEEFYAKLFVDTRTNPNGCPIRATFFLQHDYTNYSIVHDLHRTGFEIASHSMTHRVPIQYWEDLSIEDYAAEMVGVRLAAEMYARVPAEDIVGVRAPFLQMNGDLYPQMMQNEGFVYDASRPTQQQMFPGLWPYTYDFIYVEDVFLDCPIPPCPAMDPDVGQVFPGVWQVPINDLNDTKGVECGMLDQCSNRPQTYEEAIELLDNNFWSHYNGTRSPMNLFTHASWFQGDWTHNFEALKDWLDDVLQFDDVWVIPVGWLIEWMRAPADTEFVEFLPGFFCDDWWPEPPPRDCLTVTNCAYCEPEPKDGKAPTEFIMPVCGRCPPCYPNPKDPLGENCDGEPILEICPPR